VTLFPLSDGGRVLVAVTTCAVLRGGGYYLVPALSDTMRNLDGSAHMQL
jgi:hypothetical protein